MSIILDVSIALMMYFQLCFGGKSLDHPLQVSDRNLHRLFNLHPASITSDPLSQKYWPPTWGQSYKTQNTVKFEKKWLLCNKPDCLLIITILECVKNVYRWKKTKNSVIFIGMLNSFMFEHTFISLYSALSWKLPFTCKLNL